MDKFLKKLALHQSGIISPLILIGVVSVLVLFVVLGSLPIKDKLLGGLFPKQFSHAAGAVDLSLIPDTVSVAKDQTFLVDIAIDAKTDEPSAAVITITYDPAVLQATAVEQGFFFTDDLDPVTPKINNGTIQMTLGQKPNQYKTGNGIVATLAFKALASTVPTSAVQFDAANTQIAAIGKTGDQVGNLANSTVTVTDTPAITKTAQFSLSGVPTGITAGGQFNAALRVVSPEEANLFAAKLNFDPALLEVVSIDTNSSFIAPAQWVNNNFDNTTGLISLIGGVPNPGFKSTVATTMATVTFRAKAAGSAAISFGAGSAIYRNVDNVDILITPVTGETVNITGVTPSPSPSVAPSPSPSPSVAPSPSPSVAPSPSASVAPSPSAAASASPSPSVAPSPSPSAAASVSPSPSNIASASPSPAPGCTLVSGNWVTSANPVNQGKVVNLTVTGTGTCNGQSVSFSVWEDDDLLGTDPTVNQPPTTKFNSNNQATSSWLAEFQDDNLGLSNPPEYFFLAQTVGGSPVRSSDPLLLVNKVSGGTLLSGDFNGDSVVNLVDLSIILSNWNKSSDFSDELDLNTDGVVNAVDWGTLLQILRIGGVIQ